MLTTITGVYRNGQIILAEQPDDLPNEAQVLVTFLTTSFVDLAGRSIDEGQAADLRARLQTFATDWTSSEMDIYDDYDSAKASL